MAAASIQVRGVIGSGVRGFHGNRSGADVGSSLRSQFLGTGRIQVPSGAVMKQSQQAANMRGVKAIRSASFFEKLGQLFVPNPADEEQVMTVYEINELDRDSPVFLRLGMDKLKSFGLGDLVPYSNKVFGPSGTDYLGISAGLCTAIETDKKTGTLYETIYTHYIGSYGQLSGMGPYYTTGDSEMVVTGGTGIFKGARGIVKIHNVVSPLKLTYTYYITGIQKLPSELTIPLVPLSGGVIPPKKPVAAAA